MGEEAGQSPPGRTTSVGVPKESAEGERRVALVPKVIEKLQKRGAEIVVESGAGLEALIPDEAFTDAGATIGDPWSCDVVVKVAPPTSDEISKLGRDTTLIGFLAPLTSPETIEALRSAGVQAFAMESIPRISRAQGMDALSSQANVSGYKAVLLAAQESTRFFPMLTTAAGTVKPATALILGVGVAGLQALATAKRLGARTTGYDVRPDVADQVKSLGAQWLDLGIEAAGEGGYARELSDSERQKQQEQLELAITGFDVVITTAQVPGKKAPTLVSAKAVEGMRPGSVIVDLAGEGGGNCELTEPGETVVKHDVTIASPLNLPATMPEHASELYARNVTALLELMLSEGELSPDWDDEVLAKSCVTRESSAGGTSADTAQPAPGGDTDTKDTTSEGES
ncbi:Re/Si-specific NAD(P)(+) transhydrogenase subunit alpha [Pseudonocardia sp. KRD291]|uniref:Re/Si-specific NAD(P)(+) transhydrogenase subunit alpha n=1 Tax=Pseudonocardia sp. KRD291 TaxID=2792007 RepID=UPI001C49D93D|nr:Re/Si-specific NAD(P)(+) transhydrogenase subunit alpha [Pseudonocardia sp. KRD291]MBW0103442.1 Re/Si-specific NAD(P)(+) transhydrogenase subunit alpha [Pseudonocardia sp. KRD291]